MADDKQLRISIVVDGQERALADLDKVADKARESANPASSSNLGDLTAAASKHRENAREKAALYRQEKFLMQELADLDEKRMLAATKREAAEVSHASAATGRMASFKGGAAIVAEVAKASLDAVGKVVDRAEKIDPKFGKKLREDFLGILDLAHPLDALMKKISEGANKELDALEASLGKAKEMRQVYLDALAKRGNESIERLEQEERMRAVIEEGNQRIIKQYHDQKDAIMGLQSGLREATKAQIAFRAQTDANYTPLQQGMDLRALDKEAAEQEKQKLLNQLKMERETAERGYQARFDELKLIPKRIKILQEEYEDIIKNISRRKAVPEDLRSVNDNAKLTGLNEGAKERQDAIDRLEKREKALSATMQSESEKVSDVATRTKNQSEVIKLTFEESAIADGFKGARQELEEVAGTLSQLGTKIKEANETTLDSASRQSLEKAGEALAQSVKDGKVTADEFTKIIGEIQSGMRVSTGAAYKTLKQAYDTVKEGKAVTEANTAQIERLNVDLGEVGSQLRALKERAERATPPSR